MLSRRIVWITVGTIASVALWACKVRVQESGAKAQEEGPTLAYKCPILTMAGGRYYDVQIDEEKKLMSVKEVRPNENMQNTLKMDTPFVEGSYDYSVHLEGVDYALAHVKWAAGPSLRETQWINFSKKKPLSETAIQYKLEFEKTGTTKEKEYKCDPA
jgi:hypothetical protein